MQSLDFSQIRSHDGSQNGGFEELVCQLAHLSKPESAEYFVRKDGAGGDAGIECYWKLNDESEHAWQAKYFLKPLRSSQWRQISESVESALDKHPKLTKYYICLPKDRNDSRRKDKNGKQAITELDKWQEHVKRWEEIAANKSMQVEFCYWGKHELSLMLQKDTAEFSGRARYWFSAPILTSNVFERLSKKSKNALGERYTPEHHLNLPIARVFDALGNTKSWRMLIEENVRNWNKHSSQAKTSMAEALKKWDASKYCSFRIQIDDITTNLQTGLNKEIFVDAIDEYIKQLSDLSSHLSDIRKGLSDINDSGSKSVFYSIQSDFYQLNSATHDLLNFLKSGACKSAQLQNVLLIGDAGIGKSHLLCAVSLSRLAESLPTVFLLGQHYVGRNPLATLKDMLGLDDASNEEFLGALDAAGETHKTNTLIVIDAINEGSNREDWKNHLSALLTDISRFRHISIVLSCRTTYVDWLVPKELIDKSIIKIKHYGFKDFEHRAVSEYLNRQGIAKPSMPIISPEFTNPLFLKTCCKAMREQGMTEFPKGLRGISNLIEFYLDSIERSVATKKHYRPGENVVRKALEAFASSLYPDNQFGLPTDKAVALVNGFDTRPNYGESLFDVLFNESVFAEDVGYETTISGIRDRPVVRFTYERFSDQFIAISLVKDIDNEEIVQAFGSDGKFSRIVGEQRYKYTGILAALSIIVAEEFGKEIVDLLPRKIVNNQWVFEQVFTDTLQWRTAESFSTRTLELLNKIPQQGFYSPSIDVLLKLSTEPKHPWNAEFLHENLIKQKMPERDAFWSTHIAISDYEEDQGEGESVLRSLIDWAYFSVLERVEPERIHLCSIVLIWMTSSSNRRVRDQATKSVVRILVAYPDLLTPLLEKFGDVDDFYVLERLYAIAYGVVTNVNNNQLLIKVADWVWEKLFANGEPTPHLLLRDYARGIMEYAFYKGVLSKSIDPQTFRPPYKSAWPLNDPGEQELDVLVGGKFQSSIRNSIMGSPGDFGNYTMSYVHDWSPAPIGSENPQTVYELQVDFANTLKGDLKDRFLSHLDNQGHLKAEPFDLESLRANIIFADAEKGRSPSEYDILEKDIKASLQPDQQEYFRWIMGLSGSDSIGAFSRRKAQRWVCKRAIDLGGSKGLFEDFERYHVRGIGRTERIVERIGKKYQWIALYEFLAHLADNCFYKDKGYTCVDYSKFYGPWQIHERNLDPTHWIRSAGDRGWNNWKEYWWQPFVYPFISSVSIEELQKWLWNEEIVPPFKELLQVKDLESNRWSVLSGFASWTKEPKVGEDNIPMQDAWYRINSCIVRKSHLIKLEKSVVDKNLCSPFVINRNSTGHQGFFREYPWHPIYKDMTDWNADLEFKTGCECKVENLVPTTVYEWELASLDKSLDKDILIHLPSKKIIKALNLSPDLMKIGCWQNDEGQTIFFDPGVESKGASSALCRTEHLFSWLEDNDLQLVWLVGGEKRLVTQGAEHFYGLLVYSGMYKLTKDGITGNIWFIAKPGRS